MKLTLHTELEILPEYEGLFIIIATFNGWSEGYQHELTPETVDENEVVTPATYRTLTAVEYIVIKIAEPAQMDLLVSKIQPALNWYYGASGKATVDAVNEAIKGAVITATII